MAGHSKWANIKHRKDRADKKKGKVFSRIIKEVISAVKQGGPDPKANPKLRLVLQKAKAANIPNDNIDRNIKKASSADQNDFVEANYELYGYGGVGIYVEAMTDNKNRTASDLRIATNKCGGSVATPGAVAYNFDRKGVIQVPSDQIDEDELFMCVSEHGAEDFDTAEDLYLITTAVEDLYKVKEAIDGLSVKCDQAELEMIPKTWVECSDEDKESNLKLIDWLENIDDVDAIYHNMKV